MEWINKLWHIHNMMEYDSVYLSGILYIYIGIVFINENAQTTTTWHTTQTQYGKRKPNTKDAMNFLKIH